MKVPLIAFSIFAAVMASKAAIITSTGDDGSYTSSYNSGNKWSNGAAPSGNNDYLESNLLRTPTGMTAGSVQIFRGNSLTITNGSPGAGGRLMFKNSTTSDSGYTLTVTNLNLNGGCLENGQNGLLQTMTISSNSTLHVNYNSWITAGAGNSGDIRAFTLLCPIVGSAGLTITNYGSSTSGWGDMLVTIPNANAGYSGAVTIGCWTGNLQDETKVNIGSALSLGAGNITVSGGSNTLENTSGRGQARSFFPVRIRILAALLSARTPCWRVPPVPLAPAQCALIPAQPWI